MKPSFIKPGCGPCFLETAYKFLNAGTNDDALVMKGLTRILKFLAAEFKDGAYTFIIGNKMAREITEFLGVADIFKEVKEKSNEVCEKMYPHLSERYERFTSLEEKLNFVLSASVTGNIIDVGTAGHEYELDPTKLFSLISQVESEGFMIDDRDEFLKLLLDSSTHRFLLMLDNAGEIVFDKLLIRLLKEQGKHVSCMVRGEPIANDATKEDAISIGMENSCDEIIETTTASLGYTIPDNSKEVVDKVNSMDVIIGKGQANTETLTIFADDIKVKHVFLLSKVKCETVAALKMVKKGDNIFQKVK
ncbi:MAG: damage-control phosphatase ARMT1 family protein [Promethearchaeota archaeon]